MNQNNYYEPKVRSFTGNLKRRPSVRLHQDETENFVNLPHSMTDVFEKSVLITSTEYSVLELFSP